MKSRQTRQKLDPKKNLEDLKTEVKNFCSERDWDSPHNPKDLAIGLVTEASELLEIFRFYSEKDSFERLKDPTVRERIGEELADTLCFLLRFAQMYDFDLTSCLQDKLAKNALKYPPPLQK